MLGSFQSLKSLPHSLDDHHAQTLADAHDRVLFE
jgi:hypothetical protein